MNGFELMQMLSKLTTNELKRRVHIPDPDGYRDLPATTMELTTKTGDHWNPFRREQIILIRGDDDERTI